MAKMASDTFGQRRQRVTTTRAAFVHTQQSKPGGREIINIAFQS